MFDMLKPGKGYALTFADGRRVEVDFGPLSASEKNNSSQKECDHSPASRNAEIRIFMPGESQPSFVRANQSVEEFADILGGRLVTG